MSFPVNLAYFLRIRYLQNSSGRLLLTFLDIVTHVCNNKQRRAIISSSIETIKYHLSRPIFTGNRDTIRLLR